MPWKPLGAHAREKRLAAHDRVLRLLQLDEGFQEDDWCRKPHTGFVIEGEFQIQLTGRFETLRAGDALNLAGGENEKHKAVVVRGPVTLFLVEPT